MKHAEMRRESFVNGFVTAARGMRSEDRDGNELVIMPNPSGRGWIVERDGVATCYSSAGDAARAFCEID